MLLLGYKKMQQKQKYHNKTFSSRTSERLYNVWGSFPQSVSIYLLHWFLKDIALNLLILISRTAIQITYTYIPQNGMIVSVIGQKHFRHLKTTKYQLDLESSVWKCRKFSLIYVIILLYYWTSALSESVSQNTISDATLRTFIFQTQSPQ